MNDSGDGLREQAYPRGEATPLVSNLYRAARIANDVSTLALGNPHRIARRAKNKIIGRAAARAGV